MQLTVLNNGLRRYTVATLPRSCNGHLPFYESDEYGEGWSCVVCGAFYPSTKREKVDRIPKDRKMKQIRMKV
jgi:ubiquitin C-terminal hydrolase